MNQNYSASYWKTNFSSINESIALSSVLVVINWIKASMCVILDFFLLLVNSMDRKNWNSDV